MKMQEGQGRPGRRSRSPGQERTATQAWRSAPLPDSGYVDLKIEDNIEALHQAIMEDAWAEVSQILDGAEAEAQAVYRQMEAQVRAEGDAILQRARQEAEIRREQAAALVRIEAQKLKLERREQLLARVFARVREQLPSAPQWPDYEQIARRLVREALAHMDTDNAMVRADLQTRKVLTNEVLADLSSELGAYLRPGEPLERGTGVVVVTPDGRRRYDNTLETRLARLQSALRTPIYHILVGETR